MSGVGIWRRVSGSKTRKRLGLTYFRNRRIERECTMRGNSMRVNTQGIFDLHRKTCLATPVSADKNN